MSGTWRDRAATGGPLKPADLGAALRDLAAAQAAADDRLDELNNEMAAVKMLASQLKQRLQRLEEPPAATPAKAQGAKAAGGSS